MHVTETCLHPFFSHTLIYWQNATHVIQQQQHTKNYNILLTGGVLNTKLNGLVRKNALKSSENATIFH